MTMEFNVESYHFFFCQEVIEVQTGFLYMEIYFRSRSAFKILSFYWKTLWGRIFVVIQVMTRGKMHGNFLPLCKRSLVHLLNHNLVIFFNASNQFYI